MSKVLKATYILLILITFLTACNLTKYVPEGKCLLESNTIKVEGDVLDQYDITEVLRQKPNFKTAGLKLKLMLYNSIDTAKVQEKRNKINDKTRLKNLQIIQKEEAVNKKRIQKAIAKGDSIYIHKSLDTIISKRFFREWVQTKFGEKPVIFDSTIFLKSVDQLELYLKNRGYYYGKVFGKVNYLPKRRVNLEFNILTGKRFYIDTVSVTPNDKVIAPKFRGHLKNHALKGQPFDKDMLDNYRSEVASSIRNVGVYGFGGANFTIIADTNVNDMTVDLVFKVSQRQKIDESKGDSVKLVPHLPFDIGKVYFHICDTTFFDGNFTDTMKILNKTIYNKQFLNTIDTTYYERNERKHLFLMDDRPARYTQSYYLYNGKLDIKPEVLEMQNYLEHSNIYKDEYLERSYSQLIQLGLFKIIKPEFIEVKPTKKDTNLLDVHYYLVPNAKQSFGFEPRATNSNGFLGVSSSFNYTNKNIFGGAEKLVLSISGGFESQPPVFDETIDGEKIKKAGRSFNTFEIGPSVKLDMPGLFPRKIAYGSKRLRPRTIISTAYNYQVRSDFRRQIFQLNYLWRFYGVNKTQVFQIGLPGISVIKYVNIQNSPLFQAKLDQLNDLFLKNAYSNQFIWQDFKISFEYNNKEKKEKSTNLGVYFNSSFDPSGNLLSLLKNYQDTLSNGQHSIFGVGYSQFTRIDNDFSIAKPLSANAKLHARLQAGAGIPYGNNQTSLPYDYSFFAGGSNDNRGWRARALGPGSYKYYLDTNRTATQIGDIRLGTTIEYRYSFGDVFKGAAFIDAGNVWTSKNDINREGSQFSKNFYKEIALSAGLGLRLDFSFFILRFDLGMPLTNPALPEGERWIFKKDRPLFKQEAIAAFGTDYGKIVPKLFIPVVQFGIGYPF